MTLKDRVGNNASLALPGAVDLSGITFTRDTTRPTVSSVAALGDGLFIAKDTVMVVATFSEAVTVSGIDGWHWILRARA